MSLFNYQEKKQLNEHERMIGELNLKFAKLQLEINNLKVDLKNTEDKERLRRMNE